MNQQQTQTSASKHRNVYDNNHDDDRTESFKPSNILYKLVSKSPLLIGWDDDKFRKALDDYKKENKDDVRNIEEVGFGLQGIISNAVKDFVDKQTSLPLDDLKSDIKKYEDSTKVKGNSKSKSAFGFDIREMKLYQNLLSSVKYQRDAYIMGTDHANTRKQDREDETKRKRESSLAFPFGAISSTAHTDMTYEQHLDKFPLVPPQATATLASSQLTNLASWFVPSPTMHNALLPTVLWTIYPPYTPPYNLPDGGGPLRKQIVRSASHLIPLSQPLLDGVMKSSIIWVLEDVKWREWSKGSTRGMVEKMQTEEDERGLAGSGRFVTTKTVTLD